MDIEEKAKKLENVINKLKGANLGDADRLGRMIQMLKEGSDLESGDKQYLKKLYKQYKNENKKKKKITPVGYAMIIVMIAAIVAGVIVLLPEESETTQSKFVKTDPDKEAKLDTEEEVLEFITNYKGKDNSGSTLDEIFGKLMVVAYPDEDILSSPSTTVSFFALRDYTKNDYNRYWNVELEIQTYRETVYYEWVVDTETNLVYPGNEAGKSILNILDSFD